MNGVHESTERCLSLLEQFPPSTRHSALGRELLQQVDMAGARQDLPTLDKLYRQLQVLARSLGIQGGGLINRVRAEAHGHEHATANAIHHAAGPGPAGWRSPAATRHVSYAGPRGATAPIKHPWGAPPESMPTAEQRPARLPATLEARTIADAAPTRSRRKLGSIWWHGIPVPRPYWHRRREFEATFARRADATWREKA